jgi:hypothetical protein
MFLVGTYQAPFYCKCVLTPRNWGLMLQFDFEDAPDAWEINLQLGPVQCWIGG